MEVPTEALGRVIRDRRRSRHMTQEALGRAAGYGAGAAVSISRIESGRTRPGPDHLLGIAAALGRTPAQLEAEAANGAQDFLSQDGDSPRDAHRSSSGERVKDRIRRIQEEVQYRTDVMTKLAEDFNEAHNRARDDFFMRFVELAEKIEGAPQPDPGELQDDDMSDETTQDPKAQAAFRLRATSHGVARVLAGGLGSGAVGAAVGGAAAYGTFMAAVSLGTASTGAAISGLSGVAATNAALALLGGGTLAAGGAGVAGGTMLLSGIVATPALLLVMGGVVWMVRRNRKQQQELIEKLDTADAGLADSRRGVEALVELLPSATRLLDYIAVHAGHALARWEAQLPPQPLDWISLDEGLQQRYKDFIEISACQLSLVTINVQELITSRGDDREQRIKMANEVLNQAQATIEKRV